MVNNKSSMVKQIKTTMITDTPKIGWEKWVNPYDDDIDNQDDDDSEEYSDGYDAEPVGLKLGTKILMTPMGPIPCPEHSHYSKVFNLWTAHTNFRITNPIAAVIENTEGVETMNIFSPYRLRVGIGKMFNTQDTLRRIDSNLFKLLGVPGDVNGSKGYNRANT
jgi:hypothetical protein